jgi:signal transduction histidine kinase
MPNQINDIKEANDKIRELQKTVSSLEKNNDKLRISGELKNEFISLATHQIRSPLGAIRGYTSLLLDGDYGEIPEKLLEPLNIILKSTDSLNKTVNDFLDVSRIEQGMMRYYMKDFDMHDLVLEVVDEFRINIKNKGLELKLHITRGSCFVHDDKAKMKNVLVNLIDNSIKYTQSGFVEIGLKKNINNKVLFYVKDSGIGISEETMPLLFQKFSRAKEVGKSNILGTGLGLYVAKKMVEAQKGRIWVTSDGEGKGSQFYVELELVRNSIRN